MRITIDVEEPNPPEGLIHAGDAERPLTFAGWLELVAAIERLLAVTGERTEGDGRAT